MKDGARTRLWYRLYAAPDAELGWFGNDIVEPLGDIGELKIHTNHLWRVKTDRF